MANIIDVTVIDTGMGSPGSGGDAGEFPVKNSSLDFDVSYKSLDDLIEPGSNYTGLDYDSSNGHLTITGNTEAAFWQGSNDQAIPTNVRTRVHFAERWTDGFGWYDGTNTDRFYMSSWMELSLICFDVAWEYNPVGYRELVLGYFIPSLGVGYPLSKSTATPIIMDGVQIMHQQVVCQPGETEPNGYTYLEVYQNSGSDVDVKVDGIAGTISMCANMGQM